MIYFVLIFSFLFEASFSNIISNNSLFTPLFFLTSLVILFPYFKDKRFNFIIYCLVCGLIYDIAFADSIFVNTLSFGTISLLIVLGYNYLSYSLWSSNFLNVLILVCYRIISYLILCIVGSISFNEILLLQGIYNSLIVNIIYGVVLYIIIDKVSKIIGTKRID